MRAFARARLPDGVPPTALDDPIPAVRSLLGVHRRGPRRLHGRPGCGRGRRVHLRGPTRSSTPQAMANGLAAGRKGAIVGASEVGRSPTPTPRLAEAAVAVAGPDRPLPTSRRRPGRGARSLAPVVVARPVAVVRCVAAPQRAGARPRRADRRGRQAPLVDLLVATARPPTTSVVRVDALCAGLAWGPMPSCPPTARCSWSTTPTHRLDDDGRAALLRRRGQPRSCRWCAAASLIGARRQPAARRGGRTSELGHHAARRSARGRCRRPKARRGWLPLRCRSPLGEHARCSAVPSISMTG